MCLWAQGRAESGGIVLATAYWATSAQGGVTRQGVVLTYLLSFVIGSQYNLLPPPSSWSASRARIIEYALCPYLSWKMLREVFALASFTVKIRASSHACASSSGTRCSYVLPVPRLVLPRLAYHVEHQDKRTRRGVGVRAGGSQGRRELQAAADNELVTERCAIRRNT